MKLSLIALVLFSSLSFLSNSEAQVREYRKAIRFTFNQSISIPKANLNAESVNQMRYDYLVFKDGRVEYSLSSCGDDTPCCEIRIANMARFPQTIPAGASFVTHYMTVGTIAGKPSWLFDGNRIAQFGDAEWDKDKNSVHEVNVVDVYCAALPKSKKLIQALDSVFSGIISRSEVK